MPTIGVRIVYQGNNSNFGHMYVVLKGDDGSIEVFGQYPGGVKPVDSGREGPGAEFPANEARDYPISQSAFDKALESARQAQANGGDMSKQWGAYGPLTNSCVDFAWWMMREAGLTDPESQFEGYFWPEDNSIPLDDNYFNYFRRPEFNKEGRGRGIDPTTNTACTAALAWRPPPVTP